MNKAVCFFIALTFLGFQLPGGISAYETIKIGAIYSTTGRNSLVESPALSGARLAAKEINERNLLKGRKIELVHQDGKSDRTTIRDAMSGFSVDREVVTVMGLSDPSDALAAGSVAQKAGMPFVCVGADVSSLPNRVGSCMYLVACDDQSQGNGLARFAYYDLEARRAYVLIDASAEASEMTELADFFRSSFERLAGLRSILLVDSFRSGDDAFAAQINRLKALDPLPEILMVAAEGRTFVQIVKRFRDAGIEQPIIGGERFGASLLTQESEDYMRNVFFSTQIFFGSEQPRVRDFVEKYKKEYGREPENAMAALGYDALYLIAHAIAKTEECDRKSVREALLKTQGLEGVTGTIRYRDGVRVPGKPVLLMTAAHGEVRFVKEIEPSKMLFRRFGEIATNNP